MRLMLAVGSICVLTHAAASSAVAQEAVPREPELHTFRQVDAQHLRAYVFFPPGHPENSRANAVLLFHGGGWSAGMPEWTFGTARRFADYGLVAVAIEYRLSQGDITPIDALDDVCAAFEWVRGKSDELGLADMVVGYGVSAGAHLAAATATVGCPGESWEDHFGPDALLFWSPALDVSRDGWFRKKLQGRATVAAFSPAQHVRSSTPPTSIVIGEADTVTPLSGSTLYCDRLREFGTTCELNVYEGFGHLLTRNLADQESDFDPDPEATADGAAQHLRFLDRMQLTPRP